jgi:hypothetical protein
MHWKIQQCHWDTADTQAHTTSQSMTPVDSLDGVDSSQAVLLLLNKWLQTQGPQARPQLVVHVLVALPAGAGREGIASPDVLCPQNEPVWAASSASSTSS